jgi:predicted trehalose synthase
MQKLDVQADPLFRRVAAAEYLTRHYFPCAYRTLSKIASVRSDGPRYRLAGRVPLYAKSDLDEWALARITVARTSTSAHSSHTAHRSHASPVQSK